MSVSTIPRFFARLLAICQSLFHSPRMSQSISKTRSRQRSNWTTPLDFREIADICRSPLFTHFLSFFATHSLFLFHIWEFLILLTRMGFKHTNFFTTHTLGQAHPECFPYKNVFQHNVTSGITTLQVGRYRRPCRRTVLGSKVRSFKHAHMHTHTWRRLGLCAVGAEVGGVCYQCRSRGSNVIRRTVEELTSLPSAPRTDGVKLGLSS